MENTNVTCDVCSCAYNQNGCTCNLDAIKITEQADSAVQGVDNPHYCQSYRQRRRPASFPLWPQPGNPPPMSDLWRSPYPVQC